MTTVRAQDALGVVVQTADAASARNVAQPQQEMHALDEKCQRHDRGETVQLKQWETEVCDARRGGNGPGMSWMVD
ncbi:hypothetical protein [Paraburkholderia sp. BR10882]|uniref:hypothetical protein n=1 Tax=unclassified Paraburkholderia TaxID=2615204 RepID=UPI0034CEADA4